MIWFLIATFALIVYKQNVTTVVNVFAQINWSLIHTKSCSFFLEPYFQFPRQISTFNSSDSWNFDKHSQVAWIHDIYKICIIIIILLGKKKAKNPFVVQVYFSYATVKLYPFPVLYFTGWEICFTGKSGVMRMIQRPKINCVCNTMTYAMLYIWLATCNMVQADQFLWLAQCTKLVITYTFFWWIYKINSISAQFSFFFLFL